MPSSETPGGPPRLAAGLRTTLHDRDRSVPLATAVASDGAAGAIGRAVLVATSTQLAGALAMVALDGQARRMVIAPPDLKDDQVSGVIATAELDAIVSDRPDRFAHLGLPVLPVAGTGDTPPRFDTEWVLMTSGTAGAPKMVVHSLAALTGAIGPAATTSDRVVWATFYDIRRYGGLQILLRAVRGGTDLILASEDEPIGDHLHRLGKAGVTSMSGTPSHWRRVLMSAERQAMAPRYVRLSGEIADQQVLDGLRLAYPHATIGHAYASTEAGVGFAVDDGREGFPARYVDHGIPGAPGVAMKVTDGSLRIRSGRAATRYLGAEAPALADADGYIDTGDLVTLRADRYFFVGRRGGIINVGGLKVNPEEVEATINGHTAVRMSLVRARKSPVTGAIVVADVVLRDVAAADEALKQDIIDLCRDRLERHKVPVIIRFVETLPLTPGGKLSRANG